MLITPYYNNDYNNTTLQSVQNAFVQKKNNYGFNVCMTEVNENQSGWIWGDIITIPSINKVMCTAGASVLSHSHRHHFHAYCDTNHLQIIYRTLFILTIF